MAFSRGNRLEDDISRKIIEITAEIVNTEGAEYVTVKRILEKLGTTNRVFYNRFQNVEDVLQKVYENEIMDMRGCVVQAYDGTTDFYEYLMNLAVSTLERTYTLKKQFKNYMFRHDELSDNNRRWWLDQIAQILEYGMNKGYLRKENSKELSYSVWCFCRGFSAEAVYRNMGTEAFIQSFRLGVGCLIAGLKKNSSNKEHVCAEGRGVEK